MGQNFSQSKELLEKYGSGHFTVQRTVREGGHEKKLLDVDLDFQKLAECPVCLGTVDISPTQCKNGHVVCNVCGNNLKLCPMCGDEFTLANHTPTNQLLDSLPKLCPNTNQGCTVISLTKGHEQYCEFRQTECKFIDCIWEGSVKDVFNHFVRAHRESLHKSYLSHTLKSYYVNFSKTIDFYDFSPIVFKNIVFWKVCYRNSTTKCIIHKFYYFPTRKPTHEYYFIVSFNGGGMEFTSTSIAVTDASGDVDVLGNGEAGVLIPDSALDKILNGKKQLPFSIKMVEIQMDY
ncbi:hypothetical protein J6590_018446 [Homalodisca vitripennis]|nr:hypothetical protein J6590_018446 [Homalodisca vitripennis]